MELNSKRIRELRISPLMVVFVYDNHEDVEAGGQEGAFPWHTRVRTETRVLLV